MDEKREDLSRREKRELEREGRKEFNEGRKELKRMRTWIIVGISIVVFLVLGYLIFQNLSKPLPGEAVADAGRDHVTDIAGVKYTSDPPTSGSHFPVWAKPGVYDRLISDGYFIHSLEHGYIVIYYDCSKPVSSILPRDKAGEYLVSSAYAHDEPAKDSVDSGELLKHMKIQPTDTMSWFTPENQPEVEVGLPESFKNDSCKNLVSQLAEFTKVAKRVIVAPRINMDNPVVLTAWGRIDRLSSINKSEITNFIKSFHNQGPEKTSE